jgi:hypothetical protein
VAELDGEQVTRRLGQMQIQDLGCRREPALDRVGQCRHQRPLARGPAALRQRRLGPRQRRAGGGNQLGTDENHLGQALERVRGGKPRVRGQRPIQGLGDARPMGEHAQHGLLERGHRRGRGAGVPSRVPVRKHVHRPPFMARPPGARGAAVGCGWRPS